MKHFDLNNIGAMIRLNGGLEILNGNIRNLKLKKPPIALAGLLLLFACGASAQTAPAVLDHFACYLTSPQPVVPQWAELSDQFTVRDKVVDIINDIRLVMFCNPAKKTVLSSTGIPTVPVVHPDAHLAMYVTTPQTTATPRSVLINNQFGPQTLVTGIAEILAVPSGKLPVSPNGIVSLPAIPNALELDHFRCYAASGPAINKTVALNDQFFVGSAEVAMVLTPKLFCNPVDKGVLPTAGCPAGQFCPITNYPINHPTEHMACYLMSPRTPFDGVVTYNNQFVAPGTLPTVELKTPTLLCVPSTKNENWTDIGPNG